MPMPRHTPASAPSPARRVRTPRITRSPRTPPALILKDFSKPNPAPSPLTSPSSGRAAAGASSSRATDSILPAGVALPPPLRASYARTASARLAASCFASEGASTMRRSRRARPSPVAWPKRSMVSARVLWTWKTPARTSPTPASIQRSSGACGTAQPQEQRPAREVLQHLLGGGREQPAHLGLVGDRLLVAVALQDQLAAAHRRHQRLHQLRQGAAAVELPERLAMDLVHRDQLAAQVGHLVALGGLQARERRHHRLFRDGGGEGHRGQPPLEHAGRHAGEHLAGEELLDRIVGGKAGRGRLALAAR